MRQLIKGLVAAGVLSLVGAVSGSAQAAERCSLGDRFPVGSVAVYNTTRNDGYATIKEFRGAEVFVPALPGLTPEWLQRVVSYQIASGECDFGTPGVSVSVLSAGPGFSVRLAGKDARAAAEILRRAQQLVK